MYFQGYYHSFFLQQPLQSECEVLHCIWTSILIVFLNSSLIKQQGGLYSNANAKHAMKYLHFLKWLHWRAYLKQTTLCNKTEEDMGKTPLFDITLAKLFQKRSWQCLEQGKEIKSRGFLWFQSYLCQALNYTSPGWREVHLFSSMHFRSLMWKVFSKHKTLHETESTWWSMEQGMNKSGEYCSFEVQYTLMLKLTALRPGWEDHVFL